MFLVIVASALAAPPAEREENGKQKTIYAK